MNGDIPQTGCLDWLWLLACAVLSSVWCLGAAAELGATFDEPVYMRAGLDGWRRGTHEPLLRMGTMPLPTDLATLPLYLYERRTDTRFEFTHGDCSEPLFWARTTTLLFWWLLLGYALVIGRHLAGPWGGRLAVAFLACDPNFLAHAALATTDIAATACLLPTMYYFALGRGQASWWRRIGLPAGWFGVALFAKASALAYAPLAWLLIESHRLYAQGAFRFPTSDPVLRTGASHTVLRPSLGARVKHCLRQYGPCWRDGWRIGPLGLLLVFLLCGTDWQPQRSFVQWAHDLPEGGGKDAMVWLSENLKVFSNAGQGLDFQIRHNLRGHSAYLLGEMAASRLWYYFPVLLTIKLPTALLALLALVVLLRPRSLGNWACAVFAGLLLYSLTCKVQIGIRLVLPWVALGTIGLTAALVTAWRASPSGWRRRVLAGAGGAALAWLIAASALIYPHGLCYVNDLWGGAERGYELVSDSNYDWGQGLKELGRWQEERGIAKLDVWYFGTDPLVHALPLRCVHAALMTAQELLTQVQGRHLAVSTSHLYGSYVPRRSELFALLRGLEPVGRTQTFLIYDFTDATTLRRAHAVQAAR